MKQFSLEARRGGMTERLVAALVAALIALAPLSALAQSSPSAQIAALQLQTLNEFLTAYPEIATFLGDYTRDGDWSDCGDGVVARDCAGSDAGEEPA